MDELRLGDVIDDHCINTKASSSADDSAHVLSIGKALKDHDGPWCVASGDQCKFRLIWNAYCEHHTLMQWIAYDVFHRRFLGNVHLRRFAGS